MRIKGLKKIGEVPETVVAKNGKTYETGETTPLFKAPDGYKATYQKFVSEAERGRLHGCVITSS